MQDKPLWVLWKREKDQQGNIHKRPYTPKGYPASIYKPNQWASVDNVLEVLATSNFHVAGIGIMLPVPYVLIDQDAKEDAPIVDMEKRKVVSPLGRTPLTGGRDQSQLARSSSRSFRQGWISHWVFTRTTSQLWWNPWRGSHSIAEQLEDAPHVICQPCRHRWCAGMSCMFRFAQFMMRKAKIVRRANQVHPGF